MGVAAWIQLVVFFLVLLVITRPLGAYLYRVFEGETRPWPRVLGPVERWLLRASGAGEAEEQTWTSYALSILAFSLVSVLVLYVIQRAQHLLPLNPQHLGPVAPDLAFNTAVSFVTNTNWQAYTPETTMSYLTQMVGLAWQNFASAAVGIAAALAMARGLTRMRGDGSKTLGNFWVDLWRGILYVLLPLSVVAALALVATGVIQTLAPYATTTGLEGGHATIALGPVASQEAIKELGTNGGGFFNANSAHPFENPSPLSNFLEMLLIFAIPAALTYTYGRMARSQRQGWAIFTAMSVLFLAAAVLASHAEASNMEGKEVRLGTAASALFATVTTDASCGAVNSMHDSFTPLGGMVPLVNIQLGEVVFGGVGSGLYGMLINVILAVFLAGLMVGRTPEYLGKKIEKREIQLATIYILVFAVTILAGTAWAAVAPYALSSRANQGPHGLTELLYAFSSAAGNNGSAFAGLSANTPFWNWTLGFTMLIGRFLMMLPALALGGSMAGKRMVPPGPGTFPTDGSLFVVLLVGVIVIVGALTFFPALSLSPVIEHFLAAAGRSF